MIAHAFVELSYIHVSKNSLLSYEYRKFSSHLFIAVTQFSTGKLYYFYVKLSFENYWKIFFWQFEEITDR